MEETTTSVLSGLTGLDKITDAAATIATLPKSLRGLRIFSPSRFAVSSFLVPLARTIRYAERGIRLCHRTAKLSLYVTALFKDWWTSSIPMFRHYRELMKLAGTLIRRPKAFQKMLTLDWMTIHQPLNNLQHRLTLAESQCLRDRLLTHPEAFCVHKPATERLAMGNAFAELTAHQHDPTSPNSVEDDQTNDNDKNDLASPPGTPPHWSTEVTPKALQVALPSILKSNYNGVILHAPRTHRGNHIDPPTF